MSSITRPLLVDSEKQWDSSSNEDAINDTDPELELGIDELVKQRHLIRQQRRQQQTAARSRCSLITLAHTIISLSSAWGLISLVLLATNILSFYDRNGPAIALAIDVYRNSTLPAGLNACSCGATLAEALARECVFDSLAAAWLPPECRDDELTAVFERSGTEPDGSWPYYADPEGQVRLDNEQMAALGPAQGVFWTTREWHVAHCMFYWRKLYRMKDTGAVMERRYDSFEHVRHCGALAMRKAPSNSHLIDVPVQMSSEVMINPDALLAKLNGTGESM